MKHSRWIAMLLTLCMVFSLLPMAALAAPALEMDKEKKEGTWTVNGSVAADTLLAAGDDVRGEAEPNDDAETANWIYHDLTIAATLSGSDIDCYAFELTDASPVTVISACTTGYLMYGLFDYESGDLVAECEGLGIDEESGMYMDGLACELPAGLYCLLFLELNEDDADYVFYLEAPGYNEEPHNHDYGDGKVTREPTCTENGIMTYTCSCGDSYTEVILAEGHKFSGNKCSVCGASGDEIIASGEHDFGPITWKINALGVLTITGNRSMQDKSQSGYEWADYSSMITRVVIEDGITNVPQKAFANYPNLESVYIGNTVTVIKTGAFGGCTKLSDVTIPASVTEMGDFVFAYCSALEEIKFESGSTLTAIGNSFFEGSGITKVTLPSSVQTIGDYAYMNCQSLTEAILPEGVVKIGQNAFQGCSALKTVSLPSTLEQIMSEAFLHCFNIQRMEINSSCSLGGGLSYEDSLTTVVFGDQAKVVPGGAFENCVKLSSVTLGKGIESIGRYAFGGCTALESITIPNSVTTIHPGAFGGSGLTSVTIPDSVTAIDGAFGSCTKLKSVKLSKNITDISSGTFGNCTALTEIDLLNVTAIGSEAFSGCTALTKVKADKLQTIGYYAFKDCTALTTIVLPETLEQVEHSVFWGCTGLTDVQLPGSLKYLSADLFNGCTGLTEIVIPAGVETLSGRVFYGCSSLKTIVFEGDAPVFYDDSFNGLTCEIRYPVGNATWTEDILKDYGGDITWRAFSNEPDPTGTCGENVTWTLNRASGVLTISGTGAMSNFDFDSVPWAAEAKWITSAVVTEGVTTIGENAFYQLDNLTSVSLPKGLQVIGQGAFSCSGITEIEIPASVIQLHANAFESCFDLKKITVSADNKYYSNDKQGILYDKDKTELILCPQGFAGACTIPEGVEEIGKLAFNYCDKLTSVTIPASITTIEERAFSHAGLTEIVFRGAAPTIANYAFEGVTATAYYPLREESWTADALKNYGGTLKWVKEAYARLAGAGRSETAIAAAEELKEVLGVEKFDTIILVSGEGFADALAGSYLAVKKDAPILLVQKSTIEVNKNYITDNLAQGGTVYILGGPAAVPQEMEDALKGLNVKRLQGADRYETNLLILEEAGIKNEEILICTGWDFADSLSASATGLPILMLNTGKNVLTDAQSAFLKKYADNDFSIIGGTAAVSEKLETAVEAVVGEVDRVFGESREKTSVAVAKRYFSVPDYAVVAYSRNFPDGLCGGPLAHALKAPLLLVSAKQETAAAEYVKTQGITQGFVLGGTAAVTENSARIVFGMK